VSEDGCSVRIGVWYPVKIVRQTMLYSPATKSASIPGVGAVTKSNALVSVLVSRAALMLHGISCSEGTEFLVALTNGGQIIKRQIKRDPAMWEECK